MAHTLQRTEAIKAQLREENPDALLADGLDRGLIGVSSRCGQPALAVYDINACIRVIMKRDGLFSWEEAAESFAHNMLGAWLGEGTPIFVQLQN